MKGAHWSQSHFLWSSPWANCADRGLAETSHGYRRGQMYSDGRILRGRCASTPVSHIARINTQGARCGKIPDLLSLPKPLNKTTIIGSSGHPSLARAWVRIGQMCLQISCWVVDPAKAAVDRGRQLLPVRYRHKDLQAPVGFEMPRDRRFRTK